MLLGLIQGFFCCAWDDRVLVNVRTLLTRGAGILRILCCGDAFEFSICGGIFGLLAGLRISSVSCSLL